MPTAEEFAALKAATENATQLAQLSWLLLSASLVLFMQVGFCALEAGSVRHKNSINVAIKNVIDLLASFAAYFVIGYSIMFAPSYLGLGFFGTPDLFLTTVTTSSIAILVPNTMPHFFFQATFCNTAATIVSGGIAERCRFFAYVLVSIGVGLFIYPVFGHWAWAADGWLCKMGYHDFAGSSAVHMLGGCVALAGIQILGPRIGRFDEQGRPVKIPASSMPLVAIGALVLIFGWIGFNGGSAALGLNTALIVTNTIIACCFGGLIAMLVTWAVQGLASVELVLNGLLGGLVAITAGADCVTPTASAIIGIAGGIVVVVASDLMERFRLDDAVGAVPVHLVAGIAGILCTGVFANQDIVNLVPGQTRLALIGVQALGACVALMWGYGMGLLLWFLVSRVTTLRVGELEEQVGLNFSEHQVEDAIHELTGAVLKISKGHASTNGLAHFDNARDGETAALAQAILALVEQAQARMQLSKQYALRLEEARLTLMDQQSQGEEVARKVAGQAEEVQKSLDNVIAFLEQYQKNHTLFPILSDLVKLMRDRIEQMKVGIPATVNTWNGVGQVAQRLDEIKFAALRGDMR